MPEAFNNPDGEVFEDYDYIEEYRVDIFVAEGQFAAKAVEAMFTCKFDSDFKVNPAAKKDKERFGETNLVVVTGFKKMKVYTDQFPIEVTDENGEELLDFKHRPIIVGENLFQTLLQGIEPTHVRYTPIPSNE